MIEIRHKDTGEILHVVEAETLEVANLSSRELSGADFSNQFVQGAFFHASNLSNANLAGADLRGAQFTGANLTGASLEGANLEGASFFNAIVVDADLSDAILIHANFSLATLTGTDLTCATFGRTQVVLCETFHQTKGLDEINHVERIAFDDHTLKHSIEQLSNDFLRDEGYSNDAIKEMRIRHGHFHSCFLSYARLDNDFEETFYNNLKEANVPCWRDKFDSRVGLDWWKQIMEEIRSRDKILLICSKTSLARPSVIKEIIATIQVEQDTGKSKLMPIDLDGYIRDEELNAIADDKVSSGAWSMNWVKVVKTHQIANFQDWKDPIAYKVKFDNLLRHLKDIDGPSLSG